MLGNAINKIQAGGGELDKNEREVTPSVCVILE